MGPDKGTIRHLTTFQGGKLQFAPDAARQLLLQCCLYYRTVICPNMSRPHPLCLLSEVASSRKTDIESGARLFSSGVPSHDFYRNFCSACAVTVVIFGHLNSSFQLLSSLLTFFNYTDRARSHIHSGFINHIGLYGCKCKCRPTQSLEKLSPSERLWIICELLCLRLK